MRDWCLAVAGVALVLAVGCRSGDDAGGRPSVALVTKAMDSEFWLSMKKAAQQEARRSGIELAVLAPQREVYIHEQVNILEDQLVRGVDALVVAPAGVAQIIPVLERARAQKVPVIVVDTDIDWDGKLSYIGTDNRGGGRLAGEFLARELGGKGRVALVRGLPGVASQDQRAQGFVEAIAGHPEMTLVANQSGNSERAMSMSVMENIISANDELDGVFAASDEMALGVVEAIAANGKQGRITVVGFDGGAEALQALRGGKIRAVVVQHPERMGLLGIEAAEKALRGEPVEPRIDSGTELVTADNLDDYLSRAGS